MVGLGAALINMALLGLLCVSYVLVLGGELNGPVIGGIFTVVGLAPTESISKMFSPY